MTINKDKKQDNDKLVLRFDRVDQLQKQLEEIAEVIKGTDDFSYLDDFRNTVIMGLSRLTNNQRNKINELFIETGIFKLIADKRKELLENRVLARNNGAPKVQKGLPKSPPKKKFVRGRKKAYKAPAQPREFEKTEGESETLTYNGIELTLIKSFAKKEVPVRDEKGHVMYEKDEDGKLILDEKREKIKVTERKEIIQVVDIQGGRLKGVSIGNVYQIETLPKALRFAMFPEQESAYLAELRKKEEGKKAYRDEQSKLHKGNEQSKNNKDKEKKQGGKRGKRAA